MPLPRSAPQSNALSSREKASNAPIGEVLLELQELSDLESEDKLEDVQLDTLSRDDI